jgi:endonuclease/exonuclease/phosphatase (EEP) superfamily protein YafD
MMKDFLARCLQALARYARYGVCFVALAMLLGQAGRWHWFPDLFSHFFIQYGLLLLALTVILFLGRAGRWRWAALILTALAGIALVPFWLPVEQATKPDAQATRLNLLQFNAQRNTEPLVYWLIRHRREVDVVLVLEADPGFEAGINALSEEFPHHLARLDDSPFGIALLSRYPLYEAQILEPIGPDFPALEAHIIAPGGPLRLIGIHPPPPLNRELAGLRDRFMAELASRIESEEATLVSGDFNATVWSSGLRAFMAQTRLSDAQRGFGLSGSWPSAPACYSGLLCIPIDLTLVSENITVEARQPGPPLGSDHLPVLTRVVY